MARHPLDPRGTRAWRKLRDQVVTEEPLCWLRLPGCTGLSTTADHVTPWSRAPHLAMERANLHGACFHCNSARQDKLISELSVPSTSDALRFFD